MSSRPTYGIHDNHILPSFFHGSTPRLTCPGNTIKHAKEYQRQRRLLGLGLGLPSPIMEIIVDHVLNFIVRSLEQGLD